MEERARRDAEEARRQTEERARRDAEDARRQIEERARRDAEEARRQAEEQARRYAEMARIQSVSSFLLNKVQISFIDDDLDFRREMNRNQVTVIQDQLVMITAATAIMH